MGEEDPLRGWHGSGTIFFSQCNLRCQFCQNSDISQSNGGTEEEAARLAEIMLELQNEGCHNINLVSPTHVIVTIITAVYFAAQAGLHIPLVYNTGGYDSAEALALMDGIIDIYMPDMKYANAQVAQRYSRIPRYPQVNQQAVRLMHRQVGDLQIDAQGLAQRGLLVRHLVLPNKLAGTEHIMKFLAQEISPNTYVNIMDQYHPAYRAKEYPQINCRVREDEINYAVNAAREAGLERLDHLM
jgi:putative pyruvate formate lyase activating enzyme